MMGASARPARALCGSLSAKLKLSIGGLQTGTGKWEAHPSGPAFKFNLSRLGLVSKQNSVRLSVHCTGR
jgi:hypothetical protein